MAPVFRNAGAEPGPGPGPTDDGRALARDMLSWKTSKSARGSLAVLGPDSGVNVEVMRWAERVCDRIERLVGARMAFVNHDLRITVVPSPELETRDLAASGAAQTNAAVTRALGNEPFIRTSADLVGNRISQRLVLYQYGKVAQDEAELMLCRLIVTGYAMEATGGLKVWTSLPDIPLWLYQGLAGNLDSGVRAQNRAKVLADWSRGKLPSFQEYLRRDPAPAPAAAPGPDGSGADGARSLERAVSGMFVAWLVSLPDRKACFQAIFGKLAAREAVEPAQLMKFIPGCSSSSDLLFEWDKWVLAQRGVVHDPGEAKSPQVAELQNMLVVYPGEAGLAARPGVAAMTLADLIGTERSDDLAAFCRRKAGSLKVLALGRGDEFGEVVESYCLFLAALEQGEKPDVLAGMLREAEQQLAGMKERIAEPPPSFGSAAGQTGQHP